MTLWLTLSALVHFLIFIIFGRLVSSKQLAACVIASMSVTFFALLSLAPQVIDGAVFVANYGTWVVSDIFEVNWTFSIDALTYTMLIVVFSVSTLVHVYSTDYMSEDPHLTRFMSYLSLFTFFMLLLITSDNFVGLFLGWEGVGLCSYLLISFWSARIQANKAAIQAMIVNRIADLTFTVGIAVIFYTFQTVEFNTIFGLAPYFLKSQIMFGGSTFLALNVICVLLFLGAMGKSAQIGLHTWLPSAMEGPTPVSALIHAATMVTAGVFLVIRCSALFECVPSVLMFVAVIGAGTAFVAATSGVLQNDFKKVVAYSTCSQLGYMIFSCGLSNYALSLFHLANHAFFKALLFLSAGATIHATANEQDLRRFGALVQTLPFTYVMVVIGSLSLMGFPFFSGYYSKELILEMASSAWTFCGPFTYFIGLLTALCTSFYSFRPIFLAFATRARLSYSVATAAHEVTPRMGFVLGVLAFGSLFSGYLGQDLFIGAGTSFWNGAIATAPASVDTQLAGEYVGGNVKLLPFFGVILMLLILFSTNRPFLSARLVNWYAIPSVRVIARFFSHKWFFDTIYNRLINQPVVETAYTTFFRLIDKGGLEWIGPTGGGIATLRSSGTLNRLQTGRVTTYASLILWSIGALICLSMFFIIEIELA